MRVHSSYRFPFAAYPALRIALLFATGIIAAHLLSFTIEWQSALLLYASISVLWIMSEWLAKRKVRIGNTAMATGCYALLIIMSGATAYSMAVKQSEGVQVVQEKLTPWAWEEVAVTGTIREAGRTQSARDVQVLQVTGVELEPNVWWRTPFLMRVYGDEEVAVGSAVEGVIRLYAFPEVRNPHEFDYGRWLLHKGIAAHGEWKSLNSEESQGFTSAFRQLRQAMNGQMDALFNDSSAPLAKALFLGYKDDLTPEERQQFSRAGLAHIMAVSGLHVGFIVAPFWLLIPYFWQNKRKKWMGLMLLTLLLIGYAGVTGFSASVSRASVMAWLLTYGKLFHKVRFSMNMLAVAALILLLISPGQLFDVGFQLSFAAVAVIMLTMPEAQRLIPQRIRFKKSGAVLTIILISAVVQVGLFPILVAYFGEFSVAGPIANLFVVPLLGLLIPVGIALVLLSFWFPDLAGWVALPLDMTIQWIGSVAAWFGGSEASYWSINLPSPFLFVFWVGVVLLVASIRLPPLRWKMVIAVLVSAHLVIADRAVRQTESGQLTVTLLDVGQGDAIHIETPNGNHILIDAGRWSPGYNSGDRVLLPYFEYKGIHTLDAVILTHPHADHMGGLPTLVEEMQIRNIYQNGTPYNSELYRNTMARIDEKRVEVVPVDAGTIIETDPAVRLFVMGPEAAGVSSRNVNNQSVVVRLQYGETSFLFTGDAEEEQERELMKRYGDFLDVDFLKIGHHGSRTSTTKPFAETVRPRWAAASLAYHNRFSHPNREPITHLAALETTVSFTSLEGALMYRSDGKNITPIDWK